MVNMVQESGNYWIANNFIWGWLLIPVSCLVQVIQKNSLEKITKNNVIRPCVIFLVIWILTGPLWETFIKNIMGIKTAAEVTGIVKIMFPFYICYMASACIDAWFISIGKTVYMFINSTIVNIVYYGVVYIIFKNNLINPDMKFIEVMFGAGMIVHLIISIILYIYHQRKYIKNLNYIITDTN